MTEPRDDHVEAPKGVRVDNNTLRRGLELLDRHRDAIERDHAITGTEILARQAKIEREYSGRAILARIQEAHPEADLLDFAFRQESRGDPLWHGFVVACLRNVYLPMQRRFLPVIAGKYGYWDRYTTLRPLPGCRTVWRYHWATGAQA